MSRPLRITLAVAAYLAAIVAANLLAARYGPAATVAIAFGLIALDLTTRDLLHDAWHGSHLALKMGALIAVGLRPGPSFTSARTPRRRTSCTSRTHPRRRCVRP